MTKNPSQSPFKKGRIRYILRQAQDERIKKFKMSGKQNVKTKIQSQKMKARLLSSRGDLPEKDDVAIAVVGR